MTAHAKGTWAGLIGMDLAKRYRFMGERAGPDHPFGRHDPGVLHGLKADEEEAGPPSMSA